MKLKRHDVTPPGGWVFHVRMGELDAVAPEAGRANGIGQLEAAVRGFMQANGIPVPESLREHIEHQICLRLGDGAKEWCWNSGIGDKLHHEAMKPALQKIASVLESGKPGRLRKLAARAARRLSECSGCSGTRVYDKGRDNLGRAGKLNRIGKALRIKPS